MTNNRIFLLLPAYNEAKALPSLLASIPEKLKGFNYEAVVVDDGSSDGTAAVAKKYPVTLLSHNGNKGLGVAVMTGFQYALQKGADSDLVVTMDADDTHDPALIRTMMLDADVVIASRYCAGGVQTGVGKLRTLLSQLGSIVLRFLFPIKGARDYSSGYRAYKWSILSKADKIFGADLIENRGFACMPEILMKLAALGAKVKEVPLVMHYEVKKSASKYDAFALFKGYLALYFGVKKTLRKYRVK